MVRMAVCVAALSRAIGPLQHQRPSRAAAALQRHSALSARRKLSHVSMLLPRYESLGWKLLRYNSNVHREASLTITVGPERESPVGPRGDAHGAVVQLTYVYGSKKVSSAGGLDSIVLAAGTRPLVSDVEALTDPDGYAVQIVQ